MTLASAVGVLAAIWSGLAALTGTPQNGRTPRPLPGARALAQAFYLDKLPRTALLVRPYRAVAGFLWREVDDGGI